MKIQFNYDVDIEELVINIADEIQDHCDFSDCWSYSLPEAYWDDCNESVRKETQRMVDALVIEELTKRLEKGETIFE